MTVTRQPLHDCQTCTNLLLNTNWYITIYFNGEKNNVHRGRIKRSRFYLHKSMENKSPLPCQKPIGCKMSNPCTKAFKRKKNLDVLCLFRPSNFVFFCVKIFLVTAESPQHGQRPRKPVNHKWPMVIKKAPHFAGPAFTIGSPRCLFFSASAVRLSARKASIRYPIRR